MSKRMKGARYITCLALGDTIAMSVWQYPEGGYVVMVWSLDGRFEEQMADNHAQRIGRLYDRR